MTTTRRSLPARLAAAVSAALAATGIGVAAPAPASAGPVTGSRPTAGSVHESAALERYAPATRQVLPAAMPGRAPVRSAREPGRGPRRSQRALGPDATSVQAQLPGNPRPATARPGISGTGERALTTTATTSRQPSAAITRRRPGAPGPQPAPGGLMIIGPAGAAVTVMPVRGWRSLLEAQWQARLRDVIELSLAYHDAAERAQGGRHTGDHAAAGRLRNLLRRAVTARRALADTEEALARLSEGRYGRCEQCAAVIPASRLAPTPDARYCPRCDPGLALALT